MRAMSSLVLAPVAAVRVLPVCRRSWKCSSSNSRQRVAEPRPSPLECRPCGTADPVAPGDQARRARVA